MGSAAHGSRTAKRQVLPDEKVETPLNLDAPNTDRPVRPQAARLAERAVEELVTPLAPGIYGTNIKKRGGGGQYYPPPPRYTLR